MNNQWIVIEYGGLHGHEGYAPVLSVSGPFDSELDALMFKGSRVCPQLWEALPLLPPGYPPREEI